MRYHSQLRPGSFSEQTHIVTGGGSGIGRCIAHELASLGARVLLIGRSLDKLERVAGEIVSDGGECSYYSLDIRDEQGVKDTVAKIVQAQGRIHGLVNNAGGQFPSALEHIPAKGFDAVLRSNLLGGFLMAREVYVQSMKTHGGSIVNITADNAGGMPMMGHSGAARAGMENLTKPLHWNGRPPESESMPWRPAISSPAAWIPTIPNSCANCYRASRNNTPLPSGRGSRGKWCRVLSAL